MILRNWSGKSGPACGTISLVIGLLGLLACGSLAAQTPSVLPVPADTPSKNPAIALIDATDAREWQTWAKGIGWSVIAPAATSGAIDVRVQALASAVQDAIQKGGVDPGRIYLAGRGEAAAGVFYTISRVPDLWAAAVALGGSPQPAIDTDRIFAANFKNVPVLWVSSGANDEGVAGQLKSAGLNVEWRPASATANAVILDWLSKRHRDDFPADIDCETNAPSFARCYWIQMDKFDVNERNDVLPSTQLKAGSRASLDLGGFGYKPDDLGPGVLVSFLPEKYSGPLKLGDRIVALDGRPLDNARQFAESMAKAVEERPVVAAVQRGKERIRLETRIVLPRRDPVITARVQAQYLPAEKEIQIVSRTIKQMRVTVPPHWAEGAKLFWNGLPLNKIEAAGCWVLTIDKELLHSAKCP
jgi:predicted esterase